MRCSLFVAITVTAAAMAAGCTVQPTAITPPRSTEISYRTELPGSEGRHALEAGQSLAAPVEPLPGNPLPQYPVALIGDALPPIEMGVLVEVDVAGGVAALQVGAAEPVGACNGCADAFRTNVEQALQHWQFRPLQIVDWVDGPDTDGDGEADTVERGVIESRPYSLRLRFRFEVHDGKSAVTAIAG